MDSLVIIYTYCFLFVCMTWIPNVLYDTCSCYFLISLFEGNSGCMHSNDGDMRYVVYMRVSLFGLSPRRTNFMNPSTELKQLVLSHLLIIHYLMPHFMLLCVCSRHDFRYMLFRVNFIDTRVFACARYLASYHHSLGSFWLSWVCPDRGAWSMDFLSIDQNCTAVAWWTCHRSFLPVSFWPALEISSYCSWAFFVMFNLYISL